MLLQVPLTWESDSANSRLERDCASDVSFRKQTSTISITLLVSSLGVYWKTAKADDSLEMHCSDRPCVSKTTRKAVKHHTLQ